MLGKYMENIYNKIYLLFNYLVWDKLEMIKNDTKANTVKSRI